MTQYGAELVDAKSMSINDVLEQRFPIEVPRYQRAYAWDEDEYTDFINDITALLASPSGTASHFFGGLVCISVTDHTRSRAYSYQVVDGQQRMATFMLALSCVVAAAREVGRRAAQQSKTDVANSAEVLASDVADRLMFWKDADVPAGRSNVRPRMTLSLADDEVFQALVQGSAVPTPTRESHELLIAAQDALRKMTDNFVGTTGPLAKRVEKLVRLRDALVRDSHVIHIVSKDRTQAYRLFSVLNNRGESLSDADLLRSRSLELLDDFDTEREAVAALWDEMLATPAKEVEAFFRAYYPSVVGSRAGRDLFDDTSAKFLPASAPTSGNGAQSVVKVIATFRDELGVYRQLSAGEWPFDRSANPQGRVSLWQVDRLKRLVITLKHELALPVLLAGARTLSEMQFADLVYMLEIFAFRYKNICNGHASKPSSLYYKEAAKMRASGRNYHMGEFRDGLKALIDGQANDTLFRQLLVENLRYSNASQRGNIREFLTTLEDHWRWWKGTAQQHANANPKPDMAKVIDVDNVAIEHIYPQNAKPADRGTSMEPLKHQLGNLTFFSPTDNVSAGNKPFADKRNVDYPNSSIRMTADLAGKTAWTDADIKAREADLLDAAVRVFVV
jgi:hypothetical protein